MQHAKKSAAVLALGTIAILAAASVSSRPRALPLDTCKVYTKLQGLQGRLPAQNEVIIRQWQTGCTGAVMASAGRGYLYFERLESGNWRELAKGISVNLSSLPPGSYRLRVKNINHTPLDYLVRLSYGIG